MSTDTDTEKGHITVSDTLVHFYIEFSVCQYWGVDVHVLTEVHYDGCEVVLEQDIGCFEVPVSQWRGAAVHVLDTRADITEHAQHLTLPDGRGIGRENEA